MSIFCTPVVWPFYCLLLSTFISALPRSSAHLSPTLHLFLHSLPCLILTPSSLPLPSPPLCSFPPDKALCAEVTGDPKSGVVQGLLERGADRVEQLWAQGSGSVQWVMSYRSEASCDRTVTCGACDRMVTCGACDRMVTFIVYDITDMCIRRLIPRAILLYIQY